MDGGRITNPLMTKAEYARHRHVSTPYITKLAQHGVVLVMPGDQADVRASGTVLNGKPVEEEQPNSSG